MLSLSKSAINIYIYITIFIIIISLFLLKYILTIENEILRQILLWFFIIVELNLVVVIFTLYGFKNNKFKLGQKGDKGEIGPRGFKMENSVCNECGEAKYDRYGGDINDNNIKITNDKLVIGKCKFPVLFNNEFHYDCVKESRTDDIINDASINGWCATSVNSNMSYKTFAYCKNSEDNLKKLNKLEENHNIQENYLKTNSGIVDLKIISGEFASKKCEDGYKKINHDLNGDNGNFTFFCKKYGLGDTGIVDINITEDICDPAIYTDIGVININYPGTYVNPVRACIKKGNTKFIKDIIIDKTCPEQYQKQWSDSKKGISICTSTSIDLGLMIDSAFIYSDNNLYFFKQDDYWKYNINTSTLEEGYPQKISSFWGNLPTNIDAVFNNPDDNDTYFFKFDLVYRYDKYESKIHKEYPKKITDIWKGVPSNLDAVHVDKNKTVYFIKRDKFYELDNRSMRVKAVTSLSLVWPGAPSNISAMFFNEKQDRTYIIQTNKLYKSKNHRLQESGPIDVRSEFNF